MTAHLNTEHTASGIRLTDDNGEKQGFVAYNIDKLPRPWHVVAAGGDHTRWWLTLEAAEFYALALYADRLENQRRAA